MEFSGLQSPPIWVWEYGPIPAGSHGITRILFKHNFAELGLELEQAFYIQFAQFLEGVYEVRIYPSCMTIQWMPLRDSPCEWTGEQVAKVGLHLLSQYFGWGEDIQVEKLNSPQELIEMAGREDPDGSRWNLSLLL